MFFFFFYIYFYVSVCVFVFCFVNMFDVSVTMRIMRYFVCWLLLLLVMQLLFSFDRCIEMQYLLS